MASPQLENGFTRISNELLEAIIAFRWTSDVQPRLALHVARHTYGFRGRKKAHYASLAELAVALKESRSTVHRALQVLLAAKVLVRDEKGRLSLNKDYEMWSTPVPWVGQKKPASVPSMGQEPGIGAPSEPVPPMGQPSAPPTVPPMGQSVPPMGQQLYKGVERKLERKTNSEGGDSDLPLNAGNPLDGFSEWYADYPEKKARGAAERAWLKLKPSPELRAQMMVALAAQKAHRAAAERRGQWLPHWSHPATWLNSKRWLDEVSAPASAVAAPGAVKAQAGKYARVGERHETA